MEQNNRGGFQTVRDGLEDVWDANARLWREAQERQLQLDLYNAEARRQAAQPVVKAIGAGLEVARAAGAQAVNRVKASRAGAVASALFQDKPGHREPMTGPLDLPVVHQRMGETESDIRRNLQAASASGQPQALAGAWPAAGGAWFAKVVPGGRWDDKRNVSAQPSGGLGGSNPASQEKEVEKERQGNFSYGATAAALGLPLEVALRGAGMAQRLGSAFDAMNGERTSKLRPRVGGLGPPYGDDPRDQPVIADGHAYGRGRLFGRR